MKTRQEYIDLLKEHATELQQQFGITSMRLFGSVAKNQHHEHSDVDVFVEMPAKAYTIVAAAQYHPCLILHAHYGNCRGL